MDKSVATASQAVADIGDGTSLAVGGFGLSGVPVMHIDALLAQDATDLTVVSNNCGVDGARLGRLLAERRIRRVVASYIGDNREFARQFLAGELELELTPQGTLAKRLWAGGCGIGTFFTPTGVGTQVSEGGMPWRYSPDGTVALASPPKEVRVLGGRGRTQLLEEAIVTDFALVRAAAAISTSASACPPSSQTTSYRCSGRHPFRERDLGCRPLPGGGRDRSRPDQRREGDGDRSAGHYVLRLRHQLRDDPR